MVFAAKSDRNLRVTQYNQIWDCNLTGKNKMNSMTGLLTRISQTPGQCGGRPCIRGMRIRVSDILEMLAENVSVAEILEDFPDLELEDIKACLMFAARRTDFPRLTA